MHYAKQRMIICGVVSLLFAGSALAQSHRGLEGIFQPWNAERRGGEVPANFNPPELRGRAQPEQISRPSPPNIRGIPDRAFDLVERLRYARPPVRFPYLRWAAPMQRPAPV